VDHSIRATAYEHHLKNKSFRLNKLLTQAGYKGLVPQIVPTPIEHGFRARAKFKLFARPEGLSLTGTDPQLGETEVAEMMWMIPEWLRDKIYFIHDILSGISDKYPVDGFEIRCTHGDFKYHICLSVKRSSYSSFSKPAEKILTTLPDLIGVAVPSLQEEYGSCYLKHKFPDLDILAHYAAFFQANLALLPRLLQFAAAELASRDDTRILDLFCGVGLFSFIIGNRQDKIIGIDFNKHAVASAQKNAARLGFTNADYFCQPVERFIMQADIKSDDLVFINPGRSGCTEKLISAIASRAPEKICAVSCDPESFTPDLTAWLSSGYSVFCCRAFDMFPFTNFLETVFVLKRI